MAGEFVRDDVEAFTGTGTSTGFDALPNTMPIVLTATGTFVGTLTPQWRHGPDGTWFDDPTAGNTLTAPGIVFLQSPGPGTSVRLNCSAHTSGTLNARMTQQVQR